jgi:dihydrofolate synthase/folylpolyglutamate synthase
VTQYELLTAAAFLAFAAARAQVAVIEAGLGGRLDATNVIPSKATVLTSVGLDHTQWLGDTLEEIAAEKLAVLRDHTRLITGSIPEAVVPIVKAAAEDKHAEVIRGDEIAASGGGPLPAGFQASNLALAIAAAQTILGDLDHDLVVPLITSGKLAIPGRAELIRADPPMVFDVAHNQDGARALASTLPGIVGEQEVVCCLAIMDDKDAAAIVEALAPACSAFVCTEIPERVIRGSGRPSGSAHPSAELAKLCRSAGHEAESVPDPVAAWERARELARTRGAMALAAGSHYLLSCIWTERHVASS